MTCIPFEQFVVRYPVKAPRKHQCDTCGKDFICLSQLKIHNNQVHDKVKDIFCEFCGKGFGLMKHLKVHVKSVHLKLKDCICYKCGKAFGRIHQLQNHLNKIHSEIISWKELKKQLNENTSLSEDLLNMSNIEYVVPNDL